MCFAHSEFLLLDRGYSEQQWGPWRGGPLMSIGRGDRSTDLVSGRDGAILLCASGPAAVLLLLPLHTAILEPDFDVALRETQGQRQFHAPRPRDVAIKEKLLFQLQQLRSRVRCPRAFILLCLPYHIRPCPLASPGVCVRLCCFHPGEGNLVPALID